MEMPRYTQRSRNKGVVIWRSVERSFFRRNIRLHIQSPQFDDLRQHLVNGKGAEFIQPFSEESGIDGSACFAMM